MRVGEGGVANRMWVARIMCDVSEHVCFDFHTLLVLFDGTIFIQRLVLSHTNRNICCCLAERLVWWL